MDLIGDLWSDIITKGLLANRQISGGKLSNSGGHFPCTVSLYKRKETVGVELPSFDAGVEMAAFPNFGQHRKD